MRKQPQKASLAFLAAVSMIAAACSGPSRVVEKQVVVTATPDASVAKALGVDTEGELSIYTPCSAPVGPVADLMTAAFSARFPKVNVKRNCDAGGDYAATMYAKGAANNLEDIIFNADLFVPPFEDAGLLVDLEPLGKADKSFSFDDIYPSILGLGKVGGKPGVFMIPSGLDTVQMYYNVDMFQKAGAPLPTATTTWDEFVASCKLIMEKNPDTYCFDYLAGNWWAYYVPWIIGYGGQYLSEDGKTSLLTDPNTIAGLTAYGELWTKHKVAVPPGTTIADCFAVGKCAAQFHIPGLINSFRAKIGDKFKWDAQFEPVLPKKHVTGMGTYGFSISKNAKNPELAWEFLKSMVAPAGQKILFRQRLTAPLLKSLATDPEINTPDGQPPANMKAFIDGGNIGIFPQNYPVKCGGLYSGQVNSALNAMLDSIIRGAKTAAQAAADANVEIQSCLDKP